MQRPPWLERLRERGERLSGASRQTLGLILGTVLCLILPHLASLSFPDLEPGKPLERRVSGTHKLDTYGVDLVAGQALTLQVDQHRADVEVFLFDPKGREAGYADSPFGIRGTEILYAVADHTGRYRLDLRLLQSRASGARYVLKLEKPRPATARNLRRALAARWLRSGILADYQGTQEALAFGHQSFHIAADLLDEEASVLRAGILYRAGLTAGGLEDFTEQRKDYLQGLEAGGPVERTRLLGGLGHIDSSLRPQQALAWWHQSSIEALLSGDPLFAAKMLNERGVLYIKTSKPRLALEELHRSLELWPPGEDPGDQAKLLINLGKLYQSMGLNQAAQVYFENVLEIAKQLGDPDLTVDALSSLAVTAASLEEAEEWVEKARSLEASPTSQLLFGLRWGARLLQDGRLSQARQELETAAVLAEGGKPARAWNLRALLAHLHHREGDPREALEGFAEALRYYLANNDVYGIYTTLYGRAQALRALKRPHEARRESDRALVLAESFRLEAGGREGRQTALETLQDLYDLAIALRMEAGEESQAFGLAEQARARTLLEDLAGRKLRGGQIPAELDAHLEGIKEQIREAHFEVELARLGAPVRADENRLNRLFVDLMQIQARIELHTDPRGRSLLAEHPLRLDEIQRHLDADTVFLVYSLGDEQSFGWVVSAAGFASASLKPSAELDKKVGAAYTRIRQTPGDRRSPLSSSALQSLSQDLLRPFSGGIRGKRVVIVADGALTHFPFGVLPDPDTPSVPLLERHEIIHAPSASVAILLNEKARRQPWPPRSLALLADAVYDVGDMRLQPVARVQEAPARKNGAATSRSSGLSGLKRLRHTRKEASQIARGFPAGQAQKFLGFDTNLEVVTSGQLRHFEALHFATHGFADSTQPRLSGIFLSQFDRQGNRRDGLLRSLDIYDLELEASLAVLSACETGLGEVVEGEGIEGLVRAFLHAGVPRVVASLWRVDDKATAVLMIHFYKGLLQGMPAPAALRNAQMAVRAHEEWEDPFYWAGFVLQGAWR